MIKYLFIDRDGTLVAEPADEQVDRLEKVEFEPEVIPALRSLAEFGYTLVMVSNQDGLGTASFPEEDFRKTQDFILKVLSSQGVRFADILICPHFPHENCACRKPRTGLLTDYLRRTDWDRSASFVIGDRETDVELGRNMGIGAIRYSRTDMPWDTLARSLIRRERTARVERNTKETRITCQVNLDRSGESQISTGIGFFDHMLDQIATHGGFSLQLAAQGDLHVDEHHTVEDVGIVLGTALKQALGDRRGIARFAFALPMDETWARIEGFETSLLKHTPSALMDISGRPFAGFICDAEFLRQKVGEFPTEMVPHFFRSLADAMGITLHMSVAPGNTHHQVEALFKGFGRALRGAIRIEGTELPSSKGVLQ